MKVFRFLFALIKYLLLGETVNKSKYNTRISICQSCEYLLLNTCEVCGCNVIKKAKWSTEYCPKNKW